MHVNSSGGNNLRFTIFSRSVVGLEVHARDAKGGHSASNLPEENNSRVDFFNSKEDQTKKNL